jgi:general secretion pathway protein K
MTLMNRLPGVQRGVALITILLVVVIATVLAVAMVRDQNMTIQRTRNFFNLNQAKQYALGGEELSRQILWEDFEKSEGGDYLQEDWANPNLHFEFEEGEVQIQIEDLQGRLNVNSLGGQGAEHQLARARFANLFAGLGVDPAYIDRIADWIDEDANVRQFGAEDFDYLALELPYRTSGQMIADPSELRLLLDLEQEVYEQLLPSLAALPSTSLPLNINTASALVLQSISAGLGVETAELLVAQREELQGFESVLEFLQSPELAGLGISGDGLGVQSAFFEVRVKARFRERFAYLTSIVQRSPIDGSMRVIYRNSSKKIIPVVDESDDSSEKSSDV